jgi:hypothetical protein
MEPIGADEKSSAAAESLGKAREAEEAGLAVIENIVALLA